MLSIVLLSIIILCLIKRNIRMLGVIMWISLLQVALGGFYYAEYCFAKCFNAGYLLWLLVLLCYVLLHFVSLCWVTICSMSLCWVMYAGWHYADCYAEFYSAENCFAMFCYTEHHYTKHLYAGCHFAECYVSFCYAAYESISQISGSGLMGQILVVTCKKYKILWHPNFKIFICSNKLFIVVS